MADPTDSVVERTIAGIREAIRNGRYAPGQRLIVADLMQALGVSAGPVREAIRRLTGEGLVEIVPHRGASVKSVNLQEFRDLFELREAIEGLAARLAAERGQQSGYVEEMEDCLAEVRDIIKTRSGDYDAHNRRFHNLIYKMAGNKRLEELATQLMVPSYQLGLQRLFDSSVYRGRAVEHELIIEAVLDGDGARAERAMRNHVRNSGAMGRELIEAAQPKPIARPRRPLQAAKATDSDA